MNSFKAQLVQILFLRKKTKIASSLKLFSLLFYYFSYHRCASCCSFISSQLLLLIAVLRHTIVLVLRDVLQVDVAVLSLQKLGQLLKDVSVSLNKSNALVSPYLSELREVRPLVHVPAPALGDDLVELRVAVRRPLQPVAVAYPPHHLPGAHAGIRGRTWGGTRP